MLEAGQVVGRLTLVEKVRKPGDKHSYWVCRCICGEIKTIAGSNLTQGFTQSCGCLNSDRLRERNFRHGGTKTAEYAIWLGMKQRCDDPTNSRYGGRGIEVCSEWKDSFEQFFTDMGPRPSENYSIDRIDNAGSYSPENCRWATPVEQQRNKRNNRKFSVGEQTLTVAEWVEITGIPRSTLRARLDRGWTGAQAIETPREYHVSK